MEMLGVVTALEAITGGPGSVYRTCYYLHPGKELCFQTAALVSYWLPTAWMWYWSINL